MDLSLHNDEGIHFPPVQPAYRYEDRHFGRFCTLVPRGKEDSILGVGGAGTVHLARDEVMDRLVALKLLSQDLQSDPMARPDVIRETRQAMELTHPNIVRVHDFHEDKNGWGISMQYIDGLDIDHLRVETGSGENKIIPYPVERIEDWVRQLCDALAYAHEDAKMVHRDIKPRNLMLEQRIDGSEKLFLTDFGITRKLASNTILASKTQGGLLDENNALGTLPYMSWQQLEKKRASIADDIYAVGATIYDLLTGRPPYFEGNSQQIRQQIKAGKPPPMEERLEAFALPNPGIPAVWEEVVRDCLRLSPEDRPQSIREISERLGLTNSAPAIIAEEAGKIESELAEKFAVKEAKLTTELAAKEESIEALQKDFKEARATLEEKQKQFAEELAALREKASQGDAEVTELRAQWEESQKKAEQKESESLTALQESLHAKEEEIAGFHELIAAREQEMALALQTTEESQRRLAEVEGQLQNSLAQNATAAAQIQESQNALEVSRVANSQALAQARKAEKLATQNLGKKHKKSSPLPLILIGLTSLVLGLGGGAVLRDHILPKEKSKSSVDSTSTASTEKTDPPDALPDEKEKVPEEKPPKEPVVVNKEKEPEEIFTEDFYHGFTSILNTRNVNFAGLSKSHRLKFQPDFRNIKSEEAKAILKKLAKDESTTGDKLLANSSAWELPDLNGSLEIEFDGETTEIPIKFDTSYVVLAGASNRLPNESPEMKLTRQRAEGGNVISMTNLGLAYLQSDQNPEPNSSANQLAFQWFFIAAELGDPGGQLSAGQFLLDGIGTSPNPKEGIRYLKLASEQGQTEAMCRLARCYEEGAFVEKSEARARELYLKAAEAGNPFALGHLGMTSVFSKDPEVQKQGVEWLRKGAAQNHPYSTFVLGVAHLNGTGVERNEEEGKKYLLKAAELGEPGAIEEVKKQGW